MTIHRIVLGLVLVSVVGCQRQSARPSRPAPETVSDGYGERPRDQAGGVQSQTYEAGASKVTRVEELLMGSFQGVDVQRTSGDGYMVSIRGTGSFMSSEQPLWVIDGVPYEVRPGRGLGWLNPADVTKISVLKNPSETSIYGVRGANGVIIVSTKKTK